MSITICVNPALLCIGQMITAIKSGKYDTDKIAFMITQTGGGCRASNYIHLIRKALSRAGHPQIPVISLNFSGLEKNEGFKMTTPIFVKGAIALLYGDVLMTLRNQVLPYEKEKSATETLTRQWVETLCTMMSKTTFHMVISLRRTMRKIAHSFAQVPKNDQRKIKVGIVGEIYVKYSHFANNQLEEFLVDQGCEVVVPGLLSFISFMVDHRLEDIRLYGGSRIKNAIYVLVMRFLNSVEKMLAKTLKREKIFKAPSTFREIRPLVNGIIGHGCKMGEGWFLTAEMLELVTEGCENIVCAQPFGCLPNHIVGKGMIRKIREVHPQANIVAIDYDPGMTKVNQENRIKLMLSIAKERLDGDSDAVSASL